MSHLLALSIIGACSAKVWAQTLSPTAPHLPVYVSLQGNDAWSGALPAPNAEGSDGPFASIARALEAVRGVRAAHPNLDRPVVIWIRGGTYYLPETIRITPEHSGTAQSPTIISAYPGEQPFLSGGVLVKGWRINDKGHWQVTLPEVAEGQWTFTQLFVKDQRRYRPRLPKTGFYYIRRTIPPSEQYQGKGHDRFGFLPGEIRADWPDLADIEVLCFHSWSMDRMRIREVDDHKRIVTFAAPTPGDNWAFDLRAGKRFMLENVQAALSEPGEWYLDRSSGVLTYIPLPGETPETAEVVAPRLETLVSIQGDKESGSYISHIIFRELGFAHSNWVTPPDGYRWVQSESVLPGAITAQMATECVFEDCVVTHVGAYGIELGSLCRRNRIDRCEITDMGAGGIKVGDMEWPSEDVIAGYNLIRDNLIAHGGRMHPAGMGVWIGRSLYNVVEHNEICDFYQTGISVGWNWGYGPSPSHHNTIAYNRIYNIGQGLTDDMGGIYTLGESPGTVLHHNIIHDVSCYGYGGRGIYFDEGTSYVLAENNIVYRTDSGAFMQHYGRENRIINNIFALARGGQLDRLREEEHISFEFRRNIVYYDREGFLLYENWSNDRFIMDENLYWDASGRPVLFAGATFEQWQQRGHDRNSVIADTLFVDPNNGDFRLRPGSPADQIGFIAIDGSRIGRLSPDGPGLERPLAPPAFPAKPGPRPIREDFEDCEVGEPPPWSTVNEENESATIRVTDESTASGTRAVKLIDQPGQQHNFNPHFHYSPGFQEGLLHSEFDLRWESPMQLYYEWRDCTVFYRSGPLLRVMPDGTLVVNGQQLMRIPAREWVRFQVWCGLGEKSTGTWDLAVTLPGETEPHWFRDLGYHPDFRVVHWLLFTCEGEQAAVSYLDNITMEPVASR